MGLYNTVIGFTGAATGAAGAIAMVAGETDGWVGSMANAVFQGGILISTVLNLTQAIQALKLTAGAGILLALVLR